MSRETDELKIQLRINCGFMFCNERGNKQVCYLRDYQEHLNCIHYKNHIKYMEQMQSDLKGVLERAEKDIGRKLK